MRIGLVVPVMINFIGLANLMRSVNVPVIPFVIDNWTENRGVAVAWNEGIRSAIAADCDYVFIVNDDVAFHENAMNAMLSHIDEFDLLSAYTGSADESYVIESFNNDSPDFACFLIKPKEFVEKFGYFDENFRPAYFEDNDMRYRIKVSGGRQGIVSDATMYHEGSVTQNNAKKDDPETDFRVVSHMQFRLNRDYYSAKWGGWPGDEQYSTPFNRGGSVKEW